MRRDTQLVIALAGGTTVLALMAVNFGLAYAGPGVLAIAARWLIRPGDLLRLLPFGLRRDGAIATAHFGGIVSRLAAKAGVATPALVEGCGNRPTAMIVGSPAESVLVFRGPVHGLSADEKEALVAHEIGHLVHNHFIEKWATSAVLVLALLSLARWAVMRMQDVPPDPLFATAHVGAALLTVAILAFIAHEWIGYIVEAEADQKAVELIGHQRGIAAMLEREITNSTGLLSVIGAWPVRLRIRRLGEER